MWIACTKHKLLHEREWHQECLGREKSQLTCGLVFTRQLRMKIKLTMNQLVDSSHFYRERHKQKNKQSYTHARHCQSQVVTTSVDKENKNAALPVYICVCARACLFVSFSKKSSIVRCVDRRGCWVLQETFKNFFVPHHMYRDYMSFKRSHANSSLGSACKRKHSLTANQVPSVLWKLLASSRFLSFD